MMRAYCILLLSFTLLANMLVAEITVQTRFSRPKVALGNPVQYIVEITATSDEQKPKLKPITSLPIDDTGGLQLRNGRTSNNSNTRIMNGRAEYQLTQSAIIDVIPPAVGSYTIPSFSITIDGTDYSAPSATLTVVEKAEDAEPSINELVFLQTNLPNSLYLGQTTETELKLYIANDVRSPRIAAYSLSADGFAAPTRLPDSERETSEFINGRRYQVISWPIEMTPLTTGAQDVEFQLQISAQVPTQRDRYSSQRQPFGGSIFDEFFGRSQTFPIYSSTIVDVLPLPDAGQPKSFAGAVGEFAMEVSTDLQESEVGEPIMLSIKLSGYGNFERIQGPSLPRNADWKIYSPESQLEFNEESGATTSKRFDYVMIPQKPGRLSTPKVSFSFLNPASGKYSELIGEPISIQVAPSSQRIVPATPAETSEIESPEILPEVNLSRAMTREEALMTLDYQPSPGRRLLAGNPLTRTWFILMNAALLLATATLTLVLRKQAKLRDDDEYAALKQIREDLKRASSAAQTSNSAEEFYQHALDALRLAVSRKAKRNLRTAELPELLSRLEEMKLGIEVIDAVSELFSSGYQVRFSAARKPEEKLADARAQLNMVLKAL